MASTIQTISVTPYAAAWTVTEDATAAGALTIDVLGALTSAGYTSSTSPLYDALDAAFASQAAAQTALATNCDVIVTTTDLSTGYVIPFVKGNVSGSLAGNFRLTWNVLKSGNDIPGVFVLRIAFRHSIVR